MRQYSIRGILAVMAIAGLACGWALDHAEQKREQEELRQELLKPDCGAENVVEAIEPTKKSPATH